MAILEEMLDPDISILGIDEHTGVAFDLDNKSAEIFGKGVVTIKKGSTEKTFQPKEVIPLEQFQL
jgi:cyanophycinase-like exopeptidase